MQKNVVVTVFPVESEAFQAFTELRGKIEGEKYTVAEAVLLKNENGVVSGKDSFGIAPTGAGQAGGFALGSLLGILGGPLGVMLGGLSGALLGGTADLVETEGTLSAVEVMANKLYEGETAIVALVEEEEPAYDAAFANFQCAIVRYDAADVLADVERAAEIQKEMEKEAVAKLRAEREAEKEKEYDKKLAELEDRFVEYDKQLDKKLDKILGTE